MHNVVKQQAPIYDEQQELSFKLLNNLMGTSNEVTADIINVSEGTIRSRRISESTIGKSQTLVHILNMLWRLTDGDAKSVQRWLKEPRIEWSGRAPLEMMTSGNIQGVARFLEGAIDGEVGGS